MAKELYDGEKHVSRQSLQSLHLVLEEEKKKVV
jgi:hypothetical protein